MERLQPIAQAKLDKKGELVWSFMPMPRWQCVMFPLRYLGDFMAFWMKLTIEQTINIENEIEIGPDVTKSYVPWQFESKYEELKRKKTKGD